MGSIATVSVIGIAYGSIGRLSHTDIQFRKFDFTFSASVEIGFHCAWSSR